MDPFFAKTLVSALLITAITVFSIATVHHALTEIWNDLRAVKARAPAKAPESRR